jgi:hypothetical protein
MPGPEQDTFGKFFETLELMKLPNNEIEIVARGPKATDDKIRELCVWVFQRNGDNDAAATEMTTVSRKAFKVTDGDWRLRIGKIKSRIPFQEGPAIALAIALIDHPIERDTEGNPTKRAQKVLLWSQSVDLGPPDEKALQARKRVLGRAGKKAGSNRVPSK